MPRYPPSEQQNKQQKQHPYPPPYKNTIEHATPHYHSRTSPGGSGEEGNMTIYFLRNKRYLEISLNKRTRELPGIVKH